MKQHATIYDAYMPTPPLARDIDWLNTRLDEVDQHDTSSHLKTVREAAKQMLDGCTVDPALQQLSHDAIYAALKHLTTKFHLRNKAEQVHIARVNRQREGLATADQPRSESLAEALHQLTANGHSLSDIQKLLHRLDIQPTLTAHPTESRRRSVMQKQARIADYLAIKNDEDVTPREENDARSGARQTLSLLLATDEVRAQRLEVIDEVRNGINYLAGAIWDAIPLLYHDLSAAIEQVYGESIELPIFLRYRSWIGGDRDGNPNVTAELTNIAMQEMRAAAVGRHLATLDQLHRDLSVSDRRVDVSPALADAVADVKATESIDVDDLRHLQHEPFRIQIQRMQAQLQTGEYRAQKFIDDLKTLQTGLIHAGLDEVAKRGNIADALIAAKTFGLHLATLDVRQDSRVHEVILAEMFKHADVEDEYLKLDEAKRVELLREELRSSRPLLAGTVKLSSQTRELLDALQVIRNAIELEPESIGTYIISMAHDVSDVLEVLILFREVGLWTVQDGQVTCPIDVAPLFETVDDLARGKQVLEQLFAEPAYVSQLRARGEFQEIMLGYSDSNKDGGYWAANWRLHRAQYELAKCCIDAGIDFRFFHGRGGTVARGGGRAHRAILSSPEPSRNGRIRFTEQGEVISFRYAMPAIAHRHLEQITNAMLLASRVTLDYSLQDRSANDQPLFAEMESLAQDSRTAYRALIDDEQFWPWFVDRSPVLHIGELPIASRPVSRAKGGNVLFSNLRAIPWVFAWTQMRYNVPGWFGIGTAFEQLLNKDSTALAKFQNSYASDDFIRPFIDNAQQEMARARLIVASWYAGEDDYDFHDRLAKEFKKTQNIILAITNQEKLLDNNHVIQRSIHERNPDTDLINALQIELLRRWRLAEHYSDEQKQFKSLILLSVNALAAAMQSTG